MNPTGTRRWAQQHFRSGGERMVPTMSRGKETCRERTSCGAVRGSCLPVRVDDEQVAAARGGGSCGGAHLLGDVAVGAERGPRPRGGVSPDARRLLGPGPAGDRDLRTEGAAAFARWYTAWGERYHVGGQHDDRRAVAVAALDAAGLPAELIDAYAPVPGDAVEEALRASHEGAISRVGEDVGTPVISFGNGEDSVAYFGPVVSPAPKGEDAGRLLDALETMSSLPGFYELKRSRTVGPDFR